jgi:nucleotidyltransferase substrate binding protein (TIGR01987 family)
MQQYPLDLSVLLKAAESLERALNEYKKDETDEFVRDSCIQRFEYCYDLSTKMMRRFLSVTSESAVDIESMTFQEVVRAGFAKGILKHSWDKWWEYRDNRNATSHSYNAQKAEEIVADIPAFFDELTFLLEQLKPYEA